MNTAETASGALARSISRALRRVGIDVRSAEMFAAATLFGHFFLIGAFQFSSKAVRQATFVDELGAAQLPWVYLLVAALAYPVLRLYGGLTRRLSGGVVLLVTTLLIAAMQMAFWQLFRLGGAWVSVAFYLWISVATVLCVSQFWSLANGMLDARQARRLFGVVGSGGLLGGVAGGQIARFTPGADPRNALLVGSVLLLLASVLVPLARWGGLAVRSSVEGVGAQGTDLGWGVLSRSPHLRLIAVLLFLSVVVGQVVDLQFNWVVEQTTVDLESRTQLFGNLFSLMGLAAFIFQILITPRIHRSLGVGFALAVLPVTVALMGGVLLAVAWLVPAALVLVGGGNKVLENGLRYSLDQATRELLFVPVPPRERSRAKALIDVLIQRLAKGGAALLLLTVTLGWLTPVEATWLTFALCVAWLVCARQARQHYISSLREGLGPARVGLGNTKTQLDLGDVLTVEVLVESLGSPDAERVKNSLDLLRENGKERLVPPLLLHHDDAGVRRRVLENLAEAGRGDALPLIEKLIGDEDPDVRAKAIQVTSALLGRDGTEMMRERVRDHDLRVRSAAIACLAVSESEELREEAAEALRDLMSQADAKARIAAAEAIGETPEPTFRHRLVPLLQDRDRSVTLAAIAAIRDRVSAAAEPTPLYGPTLVSLLRDRHLRVAARGALIAYGDAIVPTLEYFMKESEEAIVVRRALPFTLEALGSSAARRALVGCIGEDDPRLRNHVIEALGSFELTDGDLRSVARQIEVESLAFIERRCQLAALAPHSAMAWRSRRLDWNVYEPTLLEELLVTRMCDHADKVAGLLLLLDADEDLRRALVDLTYDAGNRAWALEYIDNVLPPNLRRLVMAVFDEVPPATWAGEARRSFGIDVGSRRQVLEDLVSAVEADRSCRWLSSAAIYESRRLDVRELKPRIEALKRPGVDGLVVETARWALDSWDVRGLSLA